MRSTTGRVLPPHRHQPRSYAEVFAEIPPGRETRTLSIPVRRDHVREGTEFLYVRFEVGEERARYRIRIRDAA